MQDDGWDGLAVGEAHGLLPDPYVALGLAASRRRPRWKVGTAVAVPLRHPMLAAGAMATVQGIAGGRAKLSLGRGDGAMKVLQRQGDAVWPSFETYLRQVLGFLRGGEGGDGPRGRLHGTPRGRSTPRFTCRRRPSTWPPPARA